MFFRIFQPGIFYNINLISIFVTLVRKNKRKRRYCSNLQLTVQYIGRLFLITLTYILSDSAVWSKTDTPATFEVLHITSYLSLIIYVVNFAKAKTESPCRTFRLPVKLNLPRLNNWKLHLLFSCTFS